MRLTQLEALRQCALRAEAAETRVAQLEAENALLKRALAMLTRSLEDAVAESAAAAALKG